VPKISAPTVAEHREHVLTALVDAAEDLMRRGEPVTAAVVSSKAGIARNSIYRYVQSVDDLQGLVLQRHLPSWLEAVSGALDGAESAADRIEIWVTANLRQAGVTGHGWMMGVARGLSPESTTTELMDDAHRVMRVVLSEAWRELVDPETAALATAFTRGILDAGFRHLDTGTDVEQIVTVSRRAVRGLVAGISG